MSIQENRKIARDIHWFNDLGDNILRDIFLLTGRYGGTSTHVGTLAFPPHTGKPSLVPKFVPSIVSGSGSPHCPDTQMSAPAQSSFVVHTSTGLRKMTPLVGVAALAERHEPPGQSAASAHAAPAFPPVVSLSQYCGRVMDPNVGPL